MIQTSRIAFQYPQGPSFEFPDLMCSQNDTLLILGNSGTGKTTLLHILAGILKPQSGSIEISGKDISQLNSKTLDQFRGKNIGLIFQTSHFVQSLDVMDNLILPNFLTKEKINKSRAQELLNQLNIGSKSNQKSGNLSIGEQQRLSIARAVINQPKLILADEPTSALDDENAEIVINLLEKIAQENDAALVIVTHDSRLKNRYKNRVEL